MADGSIIIDTKIEESGLSEGLGRLGSFASKGLGVATAAVGALGTALTAAGGFALKTGMDFDAAMSQVAATMGLTVGEITLLRDKAKEMGAATAFSATEAAEALNYLALAGYEASVAADVLPAVLDLAAAGGVDLAYASDLATDAMSALGIEASSENLTAFGDKMAMTASKANTSVAQLGEAILTIGGTANVLAGGTVELNTALGVLANRGLKGAEAGTHLRNILLSLSAPTDVAAEALEELGIQIADTTTGKMRPLNEIMADFNAATAGMGETARMNYLSQIFNRTDLTAVNSLLAGCGEEWEELEGYISNADGAMHKMAETQLDNLAGDITILKSALSGLAIEISDGVNLQMRELVKLGTSMIDQLSNAMKTGGFEALASTLGDVLARAVTEIATRLPAIVSMAGTVIQSFAKGLVKNAPKIAQSASKAFSSLVTGVIKIIPDLVVAATALFEEIAANLPQIFSEIWTAIQSIDWVALGATVLEGLLNGLGSLAESIFGMFSDSIPLINDIKWSNIGTTIMNAIGGVGTWFTELFGTGKTGVEGLSWSDIGTKVKEGIAGISSWFTGLFSSGKEGAEGLTWSDLGSKIKDGVGNLTSWFSGLFSSGKTEVETINWSEIGNSILNGIGTVLDASGTFLSSVFETGKSLVEAISWGDIGTAIGSGVSGTIDVAGAFLSGNFEAAKTAIEQINWASVGTTIGNAFNGIVDVTGAFLSGGFDLAYTAISGIDWSGLGATISTALNDLVDTTGAFLSGGFELAHTAISGIDWAGTGAAISTAFNNLVDTTGAFLSAGFTAAQTAISGINWTALGTTISSAFNDLVDTTGEFISAGFTLAHSTINGIDWAGLGTTISTAFNDLVDTTGAFLSGGFELAHAAIAAIDWAGMGTTISTAFNGLVDSTGEFISGGFTAAASAIQGIDWAGMGTDIANGLNNAWSIVTGIGDLAYGVGSTVIDAGSAGLNAVRNWLGLGAEGSTGGNSDAKQAGTDVVASIASGVDAGKPTLETSATNAATALLTAIQTALGVSGGTSTLSKPYGEAVVTGIADGVTTMAVESTFSTGAGLAFSAAQLALDSAMGTSGGSSATKFSYIGNGVVTGVADGITAMAVASTFSSAASKVYTAVKGTLDSACSESKWSYVGKMICDGVAKGIRNNTSTITSAAKEAAEDAYNAAKKKLGISSPSKLFAELGMYCAQGLANGITDNTDGFVDAYRNLLDDAKKYISDADLFEIAAERMRLAVEARTSTAINGAGAEGENGIDYDEMARAIWDSAPEDLAITQQFNFYEPVPSPDETARQIRYANTYGLVGGNR